MTYGEEQSMTIRDTPTSEQAGPKRLGLSVRGLANWVLDYATELGIPTTNMALNKLVYFAVEKALVARNVLLTDAKIEAWEHGPVFREVYHAFKGAGDRAISSRAELYCTRTDKLVIASITLDGETEAFLRTSLAPFMPLNASRLREISHVEDGPWHAVWWHQGTTNPGMEITSEAIMQATVSKRAN